MDTPRSSTPVAEPGALESGFDSTRLVLSPQPGSSPAVRGRTTEDGVQLNKKSTIWDRVATLWDHAATHMQPSKKVGPTPTTWQSIRAILLASYMNLLLVCVPVSWALGFALPNLHTLIFVFSFFAIIPLSKLRAFATHELSLRVGETLAGLLHATLGNIVELIISIIALIKCEVNVVQASLVGAILSNLLLVLGMCFFAGGLRYSEQGFGLIAMQMNLSLLTISVIAVLLPAAFMQAFSGSLANVPFVGQAILDMSHGVAIILLFIYMSYLFFQLISHKNLYQDDGNVIVESKRYTENPFKLRFRSTGSDRAMAGVPLPQARFSDVPNETDGVAQSSSDPESVDAITAMHDKEEETVAQTSVPVSIALLVVVTVTITITAEFLVDSISGLTDAGAIGRVFVGIILLPIVGNAAEHVTAVMVSVEDKLTLSMGVAVGSSIQMALFVIPFIVTLGWILDKSITLLFDPLQSIVLFLTVLTVNYVIQDGKSNWLKGVILVCLYLILCVTFWYYPGTLQIWADAAL